MNKLARLVQVMYSYDDNPDDTSVKNLLRQSINLVSNSLDAAYGYNAKATILTARASISIMPP
jgi:citrate synthase